MRIIKKNRNAIKEAVETLQKNGLVVYPTETTYGIGADATSKRAVDKLNKYKQRPFGKPYSIAAANQKMAEEYAELNDTARKIYRQFLPGPVTVVSK